LRVPYPPLPEQHAIANFLDRETAKIDTLIEKQERLIELLEEKRQAVITRAVTKGLNPDVRMKDSGVEWLGEVPEHWKMTRLRYLGRPIIGLTYEPSDVVSEGDGSLVLRASNVSGGQVVSADNVFVGKNIPPDLRTRKDDLLICSRSGSRSLIGKNALIPEEFAGQTFGAFMVVFRSEMNRYLYHVLHSRLFEYQSASFLTSTINQLTVSNLKSFDVPLPPPAERDAIRDYLDSALLRIRDTQRSATSAIGLLRERRTALISAAVTGKIDVRQAV
jgi:type I restriction enzyme S subunit